MKRWAAALAIVLVSALVLARGRQLGPLRIIYSIPWGDKAGHFLLFGLLSLVVNMAAFEAWPKEARASLALKTGVLLAVLIGLEEFSQLWIRGRSFEVLDLAAAYAGAAVFAWIAVRWGKTKDRREGQFTKR